MMVGMLVNRELFNSSSLSELVLATQRKNIKARQIAGLSVNTFHVE